MYIQIKEKSIENNWKWWCYGGSIKFDKSDKWKIVENET